MVETVVLIRCDRCEHEDSFDPCERMRPRNWLNIPGVGDLCPECSHRFKSFAMDFFDGKVPDEWKLPRCY